MINTILVVAWIVIATIIFGLAAVFTGFFSKTGNIPHLVAILWARTNPPFLNGKSLPSWLLVPSGKIITDTPEQAQHKECGPHFIALVLEQNMLSCEFLVRTKNRVHCNCMGYATQVQRNWIMEFIDALLEALDIKI